MQQNSYRHTRQPQQDLRLRSECTEAEAGSYGLRHSSDPYNPGKSLPLLKGPLNTNPTDLQKRIQCALEEYALCRSAVVAAVMVGYCPGARAEGVAE
ncbi:hypothetical protein cyc_09056 [Cyclospora cayetanensis]|uniref:Uncharacterized protein n=1 Tax=Cyclospora cayetanensis TaxID=88456 RepID=A0A1D3CZM5_9EIME|nr:hypothetical protein cyc_09056 [Cyclospora cayetanensis]